MKETSSDAWLVRKVRWHLGALAVGLFVLTIPCQLFASLGGNESSVQNDGVHMQASLRTTRAANFTVHELHAPTGIVVREYVSPTGTVFGIAWQGPWLPDMRQLLGSYFNQYAQAVHAQASSRAGRRPVHIELPGLVVSLSGHPRSFVGHAFVPDMLPQGMSAEEIR